MGGGPSGVITRGDFTVSFVVPGLFLSVLFFAVWLRYRVGAGHVLTSQRVAIANRAFQVTAFRLDSYRWVFTERVGSYVLGRNCFRPFFQGNVTCHRIFRLCMIAVLRVPEANDAYLATILVAGRA